MSLAWAVSGESFTLLIFASLSKPNLDDFMKKVYLQGQVAYSILAVVKGSHLLEIAREHEAQ